MERKRKLPSRASRGEPASKKRTSTPPEHSPLPPPPPVVIEETLPKSITAGKPLPTVDSPQPENLSSKDFQSIPESGVLAESLHRSRQKWLSEGIFEKYWTKPSKKKGIEEPPNNPGKDTMTKLGTCTITVEPHVFDVTMYAIKEPIPKTPAVPPVSQHSMYRPIIQYGPPNGMMPPPLVPVQTPVQQKHFPPSQPSPTTTITKPQDNTPAVGSPQPLPNGSPAVANPSNVGLLTPNTQSQPSTVSKAASPAAGSKSTDPVIQMLAERAATDTDLKSLMRIVANGEASPEELKRFQSHIDDLTYILKSRQTPATGQPPPTSQPPQTPPSNATPANGQKTAKPAPIVKTAPQPPTPTHYIPPQPQALRSKGPVPSTRSEISGVVLEFAGGSGDRFLFPKYSILDYLPGGQVVASFLIVRKGSSSDSPKYDRALDYYQPITIRLYTHQGRQLDSLQKAVAPPEEVRRYMDDIMDNMTRAEYVLLAMRLPKADSMPAPEQEQEISRSDANNSMLWTRNNTPVPTLPRLKPAKKLLTEEEQYHTFITSVSG
ncbi:hypothetical protein B7494_g853 [Chlorociboria aeruginascens]|nr:hypothetical protein B7494_g853 [Chlorociboria aeruginascens]